MTRRFVNGRPPKIHLYSANERRTLCEYYNTLTVETTSDREKATCQRCLDRGGGAALTAGLRWTTKERDEEI